MSLPSERVRLEPRLGRSFFERPCLTVARELIGCYLVRHIRPRQRLVARLVEVEAYLGDGTDPGSHSHRGQTNRNRVMFGPAGRLYVYRIYGVHTCANVVCEGRRGAAVLLRAAQPVEGLEYMRVHRGKSANASARWLLGGPARLCRAFRISIGDDGRSLLAGPLALHPARSDDEVLAVTVSPRVGLSRGADLPYRFLASGNQFVSR